ncbi:hypothetical protein HGM15179_012750 [Zosterops borbonicus]|uniref:Endonuclease/exonuclease/phosphatase domain-containing protein n=1 Tax=Zosterops borbonicus TaxID=364589 RepID=A0A8K1G9W1_9PASS|nr:hypothetical protein HGM15179_012750 [Zosterops borbonicus]
MATSSSEQTGKGQEVPLHIRVDFHTMGIETKDDGVECLRIQGKANKADILLGVCYYPPNKEEEVDNLFFKQLENVSGTLPLVLLGDFSLPDICWELNTAERRQSRKLLECIEENFLLQLVREPTRGRTVLDLLFANRDGLVGDVVVGGHLGNTDDGILEFLIFGEIRRNINKALTLNFQRADFGLFRRLIQRVLWEAALKNKGVQEREYFYSPSKATGNWPKGGEMDLREQVSVTVLDDGREADEGSSDPFWSLTEAKAQFKLKLATFVKDYKKCFYKYINGKRNGKTNFYSLLDAGGNLLTADEEKAEVPKAFFASVFSGKMACPQDNCHPGLVDGAREQNGAPVTQDEAVRELLSHLDVHESLDPDEIHPRVMRELGDELAKLFSIIYQQSWLTGEIPDDWKLASVTPIHKNGGKEDPGIYRPVSLTSVPNSTKDECAGEDLTEEKQTKVPRGSDVEGRKQRSVLGPEVFNILINDIHKGVECTLSRFEDDPKLRDAVGTPEGWDVIQRELDKLEKWLMGTS